MKLLGLGPDGHVASLFPGSPQLAERERRVTSGPAGLEPFVDRVTMTLPMLLSARRLVFLVTGADKAEAVVRVFGDEVSEDAPGEPAAPGRHADRRLPRRRRGSPATARNAGSVRRAAPREAVEQSSQNCSRGVTDSYHFC